MTSVHRDSQADKFGVRRGWMIRNINGDLQHKVTERIKAAANKTIEENLLTIIIFVMINLQKIENKENKLTSKEQQYINKKQKKNSEERNEEIPRCDTLYNSKHGRRITSTR